MRKILWIVVTSAFIYGCATPHQPKNNTNNYRRAVTHKRPIKNAQSRDVKSSENLYNFTGTTATRYNSKYFSAIKLKNSLKNSKLTVVAKGFLPEQGEFSKDGKKYIFTRLTKDIKNNAVVIMNENGSQLREIKTPYGRKTNVGFLYHKGKTFIYMRLSWTGRGRNNQFKGKLPFLIKPYNKIFSNTKWRQIKLNKDAVSLKANSRKNEWIVEIGKYNRRKRYTESTLLSYPIGKNQNPKGRGKVILKKFAGTAHNIKISNDGKYIYFTWVDMSKSSKGNFVGLWRLKNQKGSTPKLILKEVRKFDIYKNLIFYTKYRFWGRGVRRKNRKKINYIDRSIFVYDSKSRNSKIVVEGIYNIHCKNPRLNPITGKLSFQGLKNANYMNYKID